MTARNCLLGGCLLAGLAVAAGAFGAHALKETLEDHDQLANWETAVRYQMWHGLALLAYGLFARLEDGVTATKWPGYVFLLGILLFSGSIYLLALRIGGSWVWPLTPIGGTLLLAGWLGFAWAVFRTARVAPNLSQDDGSSW